MAAPVAYAWEGMVGDFFQIDGLHDYQRKTLQSLLDGKDVFLSVRTGGGKTSVTWASLWQLKLEDQRLVTVTVIQIVCRTLFRLQERTIS